MAGEDADSRAAGGGLGAGLCDTCVHQQVVRNTRGSAFSLCRLSRTDPRYPRYPRIPVTACDGHELRRGPAGDAGQAGTRPPAR